MSFMLKRLSGRGGTTHSLRIPELRPRCGLPSAGSVARLSRHSVANQRQSGSLERHHCALESCLRIRQIADSCSFAPDADIRFVPTKNLRVHTMKSKLAFAAALAALALAGCAKKESPA